jgi:hypothetical protein
MWLVLDRRFERTVCVIRGPARVLTTKTSSTSEEMTAAAVGIASGPPRDL